MNSWLTVLPTVIAAALGGGGLVAIVNALARRKVTKIEAADRLNDSTLEWADKLQAHATNALKEAADAHREASAAREEMAAVRQEARALAWELRRLRQAILDPRITLDQLRLLVNDVPPNGTYQTPVIP